MRLVYKTFTCAGGIYEENSYGDPLPDAFGPWPFNNKKKALAYYREYQQTPYFANNDEGLVYLAELLLKLKGKENKGEAKRLLEKASRSQEKYYADWARRLMAAHNL